MLRLVTERPKQTQGVLYEAAILAAGMAYNAAISDCEANPDPQRMIQWSSELTRALDVLEESFCNLPKHKQNLERAAHYDVCIEIESLVNQIRWITRKSICLAGDSKQEKMQIMAEKMFSDFEEIV